MIVIDADTRGDVVINANHKSLPMNISPFEARRVAVRLLEVAELAESIERANKR